MITENSLDRYSFEKRLGEATFGYVSLAREILTSSYVIIKTLEKALISNQNDIDRITREILLLRRLTHPNIIQLFEIIETPDYLHLILEYAENSCDLHDFITKKTRLNEKEAFEIFSQILSAIGYIHSQNIAHRDLKPENILITEEKRVKIVDFGLGNLYNTDQLLKTPCGSPSFAAPEMLSGKLYSGLKADLWSIGVILYCMVAGVLPFEEENSLALYDKIIRGEFVIPEFFSKELGELVKGILEPDVKKRKGFEEIWRDQWCMKERGDNEEEYLMEKVKKRGEGEGSGEKIRGLRRKTDFVKENKKNIARFSVFEKREFMEKNEENEEKKTKEQILNYEKIEKNGKKIEEKSVQNEEKRRKTQFIEKSNEETVRRSSEISKNAKVLDFFSEKKLINSSGKNDDILIKTPIKNEKIREKSQTSTKKEILKKTDEKARRNTQFIEKSNKETIIRRTSDVMNEFKPLNSMANEISKEKSNEISYEKSNEISFEKSNEKLIKNEENRRKTQFIQKNSKETERRLSDITKESKSFKAANKQKEFIKPLSDKFDAEKQVNNEVVYNEKTKDFNEEKPKEKSKSVLKKQNPSQIDEKPKKTTRFLEKSPQNTKTKEIINNSIKKRRGTKFEEKSKTTESDENEEEIQSEFDENKAENKEIQRDSSNENQNKSNKNQIQNNEKNGLNSANNQRISLEMQIIEKIDINSEEKKTENDDIQSEENNKEIKEKDEKKQKTEQQERMQRATTTQIKKNGVNSDEKKRRATDYTDKMKPEISKELLNSVQKEKNQKINYEEKKEKKAEIYEIQRNSSIENLKKTKKNDSFQNNQEKIRRATTTNQINKNGLNSIEKARRATNYVEKTKHKTSKKSLNFVQSLNDDIQDEIERDSSNDSSSENQRDSSSENQGDSSNENQRDSSNENQRDSSNSNSNEKNHKLKEKEELLTKHNKEQQERIRRATTTEIKKNGLNSIEKNRRATQCDDESKPFQNNALNFNKKNNNQNISSLKKEKRNEENEIQSEIDEKEVESLINNEIRDSSNENQKDIKEKNQKKQNIDQTRRATTTEIKKNGLNSEEKNRRMTHFTDKSKPEISKESLNSFRKEKNQNMTSEEIKQKDLQIEKKMPENYDQKEIQRDSSNENNKEIKETNEKKQKTEQQERIERATTTQIQKNGLNSKEKTRRATNYTEKMKPESTENSLKIIVINKVKQIFQMKIRKKQIKMTQFSKKEFEEPQPLKLRKMA